jgi:hypothetical protein
MGEMRYAYRILIRQPEGKRTLERPMQEQEDIKICLKYSMKM